MMEETLEVVRVKPTETQVSFKDFLFKNRFNKWAIGLAVFAMVVQLCVFKYFYPYAGFINGDSYSYLLSAFYNLKINTYPIGYSKFLRLFSVFTTNDTIVVAFQYLFIQLSIVCLLFSLFYFYSIRLWIQIVLLVSTVASPLFLYLANYISSDSLFLSLSICWFSILIWILHRPTWKLMFLHAIIIVVAFMVRYNALFYPFVSCLCFFLNKERVRLKIIGLGLVVSLIGSFMWFTSFQYKKLTGQFQFSPFSGWQMANNAMYAYRFIDSEKRKVLPKEFKDIDQDVRNYFDSTRDLKKYPQEMLIASTFYMWKPQSPLRIYMNRRHAGDTSVKELRKWAEVGPLYKNYGTALIKAYPRTFAQKYLWPNFLKYYAPPIEFLEFYNFGLTTVEPIGEAWFGYNSNKVKTRFKDLRVTVLNYYPIICGMMNAVYVMISISFLILEGKRFANGLFKAWLLFSFYWICNMIFTVFASPVALRFQVCPFVLCTIFNFVLLDYILKQGRNKEMVES